MKYIIICLLILSIIACKEPRITYITPPGPPIITLVYPDTAVISQQLDTAYTDRDRDTSAERVSTTTTLNFGLWNTASIKDIKFDTVRVIMLVTDTALHYYGSIKGHADPRAFYLYGYEITICDMIGTISVKYLDNNYFPTPYLVWLTIRY